MHNFHRNQNPQLLDNLRQLTPLPPWAMRALVVEAGDPGGVEIIAAEIGKEPSFAPRFLALANSPFYGIPRKLKSIRSAVQLLGEERAQNLLVLLVAEQLYPIDQSKVVQRFYYWRQSVTTGAIARHLARKVPNALSEEDSFRAGVFLNIGQLTMEAHSPTEYLPVLKQTADEPTTELWMHEQISFGLTHADISEKLMEHWNFSKAIRVPIQLHHSPAQATEKHLIPVLQLHFANYLSRLWLNPDDARKNLLHDGTRATLGLTLSDEELLFELRPELTAAEELVSSLSLHRS